MTPFYALAPDLPEPLRAAVEETLAAVSEYHHPTICRVQDALEHGGRAAANAYEDAITALHTDCLNAVITACLRYPFADRTVT